MIFNYNRSKYPIPIRPKTIVKKNQILYSIVCVSSLSTTHTYPSKNKNPFPQNPQLNKCVVSCVFA
jgi:hypothetical protein